MRINQEISLHYQHKQFINKKILCLPKISSRESLRIDENIQIKNQLKTPNIKSIKGIVSAK